MLNMIILFFLKNYNYFFVNQVYIKEFRWRWLFKNRKKYRPSCLHNGTTILFPLLSGADY